MERFLMNPRRIAKFTQQIGACTDSADTPTPENDAMPTNNSIVDLAERHNDGLDVVLLWARHTGRVWVNVTHRRSGQTAQIDATTANALDVFRHPFAYAPGAP
jgi:hypothetical protein